MRYIKVVLFIAAAFSLAFLINSIPEMVTQAQDQKKVQTELTQEHADKIIAALREKGVSKPCPRCGHQKFGVSKGGYSSISLSLEIGQAQFGGNTIFAVVTYCERCGYIAQHSALILGLAPDQKK